MFAKKIFVVMSVYEADLSQIVKKRFRVGAYNERTVHVNLGDRRLYARFANSRIYIP